MLQAQNGRQFNLAAKTIRTFFEEKNVGVSHAEALTLVARLAGYPSYEAAQASFEGVKSGLAREVPTWRHLAHAICTLDDAQLDMKVELTDGCDDNGNAQFTDPVALVLANDWTIQAATDMLYKPTQPILLIEPFGDLPDSHIDSEDVRRVTCQFEVMTGCSASTAREEIRKHAMIEDAIAVLNEEYGIRIGIGAFVLMSKINQGFWNASQGWVDDKASATGFDRHENGPILWEAVPDQVNVPYQDAIESFLDFEDAEAVESPFQGRPLEAGDKVFLKPENCLATVLNVYGDGVNGSDGEVRLDMSGNTHISDIEHYDSVKHAKFDNTFIPVRRQWLIDYNITKDIPVRD